MVAPLADQRRRHRSAVARVLSRVVTDYISAFVLEGSCGRPGNRADRGRAGTAYEPSVLVWPEGPAAAVPILPAAWKMSLRKYL